MESLDAPHQREIVIVGGLLYWFDASTNFPGGGIIGVATAYYLTRHAKYIGSQARITLLEATSIASGASGKAGGLLALWAYPACLVPLSFRLHAQLAEEHGGAERWGYRRVTAGSVECEVGNTRQGSGTRGYEAVRHAGEIQAEEQRQEVAGDAWTGLEKVQVTSKPRKRKSFMPQDLDWLDEDTVLNYQEMGDVTQTAQVHPYQFTTTLANLAVEAGVKIVYGMAQTLKKGHDVNGHEIVYRERDGDEEKSITASDVIVTAGPWTKQLLSEAPIEAIRAHSIVIDQNVSPYAIFTDITLESTPTSTRRRRHGKNVTPEMYARPDGTIYACGKLEMYSEYSLADEIVQARQIHWSRCPQERPMSRWTRLGATKFIITCP